jgi:hypothetical protein
MGNKIPCIDIYQPDKQGDNGRELRSSCDVDHGMARVVQPPVKESTKEQAGRRA